MSGSALANAENRYKLGTTASFKRSQFSRDKHIDFFPGISNSRIEIYTIGCVNTKRVKLNERNVQQ